MSNYDVVPRDDGKWASRRAGATRASRVHDTQADAKGAATTFARNSGGGEVRVHGHDGKIRDAATIGKADPFPPRG